MMNFKGAAKPIDDVDIPRIGATIGVGEDEIHAVLDVEAGGKSFDSRGRPKMLFEPHIFYRQLSGAERARAESAGLAYPKWRRNYPKDSYPRLAKAMEINSEAALKSASWGGPQIMGFHHALLGYKTAAAMVKAFADDEENHLKGMVAFIKGNNLDDELRAHNWAGFARGYNGSGYRKNKYDTKLAAAYAKWQKIRDTPVGAPRKERPVTRSTTIGAATVAAGAAVAGTAARTATQTSTTGTVILIVMMLVILGAAGWIIRERIRKSREDGV